MKRNFFYFNADKETATGEPSKTTPTIVATPVVEDSNTLPDWVKAKLSALESENNTFKSAKSQQEADAKKADEKKLADEKKWQDLSEKREKELADVQPKLAKVEAYEKLLKANFEQAIKGWSKELTDLDPGETASIEDRMNWLEKSKPLAAKLMDTVKVTPKPGVISKTPVLNNTKPDATKFNNVVAGVL